jgi:hypothetical protein
MPTTCSNQVGQPNGAGIVTDLRESGDSMRSDFIVVFMVLSSLVANAEATGDEIESIMRAGCRRSEGCQDAGMCSLNRNSGKCFAKTDDDCGSSSQCRNAGRCTARDGVCIVATDADCRRSQMCTVAGHCVFRNGVCWATTDEDCRQATQCKEYAFCFAGTPTLEPGQCVAGLDADCQQVDRCDDAGHCRGCVQDGSCTAKDGKCVPATDADCRKSKDCKTKGFCTFNGGKCVVGSDADCTKHSTMCKVNGRCRAGTTPTLGPVCIAVSEADCKRSLQCRKSGWCGFMDTGCVPDVKAVQAAEKRAQAQEDRAGQCSFEGETSVTCELQLCAKIATTVRKMKPNRKCCWDEPCSTYSADWSEAMKAIDYFAGGLREKGDARGYQKLMTQVEKCKTPAWFRTCSNASN